MNALTLYRRYVLISMRAQMQYRASTLLFGLGLFIITISEFAGVWALFARFGTLQGWSLAEVGLLYGMASVSFAAAEMIARGFDLFDRMILAGDFDRLLLRPRSTVLQVLGADFQLSRLGRLVQGLMILAWAGAAAEITWSAGKLALVLAGIVSGVFIFCGLFILQATLAFWTTQSLEIVNTVTYGGVETTQFPLSIYHKWFRRFFTFVIPLACLNYLPAAAVLGRSAELGVPVWASWVAPLVGPVFLLGSLRAWRFGVRHYRSTGS